MKLILLKMFFYVKCCGVTQKMKLSNKQWFCNACEIANNACNKSNETDKIKGPCKKVKCGGCKKNISFHLQKIMCDTCKSFFHVKCSGTSTRIFLDLKSRNMSWDCTKCLSGILPFSQVDNNELFLELENKSNLVNSSPSFSIQCLLDQMPGQNFLP